MSSSALPFFSSRFPRSSDICGTDTYMSPRDLSRNAAPVPGFVDVSPSTSPSSPELHRVESEAFEERGQRRARVGRGGRQNAAIERRLSHLTFCFAADVGLEMGSGLVNRPVSRV